MNNKKNIRLLALSFMFSLLLVSSLSAIMIPLSTTQLRQDADVVVIGQVMELKSYWDNEETVIFTRARLKLDKMISGSLPVPEVIVEYPGGTVGEMTMGCSDQPSFQVGERVLVFLKAQPSFNEERFSSQECYQVIGAAQGVYHIDNHHIARKGGFSIFEPDLHPAVEPGVSLVAHQNPGQNIIDTDIPIDLLIDKIKGKNIDKNIEYDPALYRPMARVEQGKEEDEPTRLELSRLNYLLQAKWGYPLVHLYINQSGGPSYGLGAIRGGMTRWNNVYCSAFNWVTAGFTSSKTLGRNGSSIIFFTNLDYYLGYSNWWSVGGKIIETDVRLDSAPVANFSWTYDRLRAVVLHELGHSMGFGHVSNSSIMKVPLTDALLNLFMDDINGISNTYPSHNPLPQFNTSTDNKADLLLRNHSNGNVSVWLLNGLTLSDSGVLGSCPTYFDIYGVGDFNGDGDSDIIFRDLTNGRIAIWLVSGKTTTSSGIAGACPNYYDIIGLGDFDGDGKSDILIRDFTNGRIVIWLMNGTSIKSSAIVGNCPLYFEMCGVGDFDGDGNSDIFFRDSYDGRIAIWLMNNDGLTIKDSGIPSNCPLYFDMLGVGNFDGLNGDDILFRDSTNGRIGIWLMNGKNISSQGIVGNCPTYFHYIGVGDFDGTNGDDLLFRDSTNGRIAIWLLDGITIDNSGIVGNCPLYFYVCGLGDINGDTKTDIVYRDTSGRVAVWLMDGITEIGNAIVSTAATTWKIY